ncbi:hypothetical protein [Streptomyces jumonjinensis]|uniref:Uncharacterized protein n=1 Tax=Streptomyces jumonjinensis TaxID=1945 RepID=A0A646KTT6_STRJU|nr:hypothetical protein [Streptomyces jumonjinensis]MQT05645.1 hypothetical protein [Streptomyces jumonjinensis]
MHRHLARCVPALAVPADGFTVPADGFTAPPAAAVSAPAATLSPPGAAGAASPHPGHTTRCPESAARPDMSLYG